MKYVLFTLIVLTGLNIPSQTEDVPSTPYVYYYAQAVGGFVVERTDGGDSRLFSPGYTRSNPSASHPGWSASGEWFAWHSHEGYIERIDGQSHFDVLEAYRPQINHVVSMEWSPSQRNLLLIIGSQSERNCLCLDETTFILRDLDTEHDLVVFSLTMQQEYLFKNFSSPSWDIDARNVSINVLLDGSRSDFHAVHLTLGFDGATAQTNLSREAWDECCALLNPPGAPSGIDWNEDAVDSPSGRYQATVGSDTALLDRQTGQTIALPSHSGATLNVKFLKFNSPETWLLVGQTNFVSGGCCSEPLLVGVSNIDGTYWRELGLCFVCAEWLPERIDTTLLPVGSPTSVLPAPARIQYHDEIVYGWRNGNFHLSCTPDDPLKHILRPIGNENVLYELYSDETCTIPRGSPQEVLAAVSPDNRVLALSLQPHAELVSLWDIGSGRLITRLNTFGYEMDFSTDGRELFTRTTRATLTWNVSEIVERAVEESSR